MTGRVHVVRVFGAALAGIEIGRQRVVPDIGKPAGDVADVLDEAERLVDDDDAGVVPGLARPRQIARNAISATLELDGFAGDPAGVGDGTRYVRHGFSSGGGNPSP